MIPRDFPELELTEKPHRLKCLKLFTAWSVTALLAGVVASAPSIACDGHDEGSLFATAQSSSVLDSRESKSLKAYEDDPQHQIAKINNQGVRALQKGDFKTAIAKFEETIKRDPSYQYGKSNLGVALNNYALSLRANPEEALVYFEKAASIDPGNSITESNVDGVILMLGLDPKNFSDRIKLGNQRVREGNNEGAIVELKAALKHIPIGDESRLAAELRDRIEELQDPTLARIRFCQRLLMGDYNSVVVASMFALYALDLFIIVECMRRFSSQKRSWWIFGLIVGVISVSAGFLLGQANAFRHVLGLMVLGLPPARALYAVTTKRGANWLYMAAVFLAAIPCTIFFFGWLVCVVGPHCADERIFHCTFGEASGQTLQRSDSRLINAGTSQN